MNNYTQADYLPHEADANDPMGNGLRPMYANHCHVLISQSNSDCHGIILAEDQQTMDSRQALLSAKMCCQRMLCK